MGRRRKPDPRQLTLGVELPQARSTRAEVVDSMPKVAKRKVDHFPAWPSAGTRVLVNMADESGVLYAQEPGEVVSLRMDPERGYYCIVRLDDRSRAPVTIDRLRQLSRPKPEKFERKSKWRL